MDVPILGILGICIPLAAVVGVFTFLSIAAWSRARYRAQERMRLYEVAQAAVEKGQPLPPEVIATMATTQVADRAPRSAFSDLRTGVILTAVGAGLFVMGFMGGRLDRDASFLMGIAAIPGLIGVALIVLSFFNPNKSSQG